MIRFGFAAVAVSVIWFLVRRGLGIPDHTPLFHGGVFLFGDGLAAIVGVAGVILLFIGRKTRPSHDRDDSEDDHLDWYADDF
jgi:hypothetical protein